MTRDSAHRGTLDQAVQDLQRVAAQCGDAGLLNEEAQLSRLSCQLRPFAESPPVHREFDPFWS